MEAASSTIALSPPAKKNDFAAGIFRDEPSAFLIVSGPIKLLSKFSGSSSPIFVGTSYKTVAGEYPFRKAAA